MANARNIIETALRKIHVLGSGQSLPAEDAQNALEVLNDLIDGFNAEGGLVTTQTRETFNMTGAESYSIGPGADFDTAVPTEIITMVVNSGDVDYTLRQMTPEQFEDLSYKKVNSIPEYYYYDNNRPTGNLYFYPKGDSSYTLTMVSNKSLSSFADLTTDYDLAEGVKNMLVYNLASEVAPEYEREASPTVMRNAKKYKENVEVRNRRFNYPTSRTNDGLQGVAPYNIYSGYYR